MPQSCVFHACEIRPDGRGVPLEGEEISKKLKAKALAWAHLDAAHPRTREWLHAEVSYLDELVLDALLAEETRPRLVEFDHGVLVILRGMNLNENAEPEDMVSVRLWVDPHRIISIQRRNVRAVQDIRDRLMEGAGPRDAGDFLSRLAARLFERMEPVFDALEDNLDATEQEVMERPTAAARQEVIHIRKQAMIFRRYIVPQRDVLAALRASGQPWLDEMHRRRLQEVQDRVIRYVEELDTARERAQIVKDELVNTLSERLNRNMYLLSVIAAVFLPLGFLTGLLGVNVGGIPGAENPHAFEFFSLLLAGILGVQVAVFRFLKWF